MSLKENIKNDATVALKSKDSFASGVLRMLLASVTSKEKEKRYKISLGRSSQPLAYERGQTGEAKEKPEATEETLIKESELTDEQVIEVVSSEIKKRKDAIVLYEKGNRPELAEREKKEIEILKKYLPEQLSEEELKKIVEESINKTEAKEMKDMGKVMADLNPKIKGRADSGEVSKIVKELLIK